ncbi:MAG: DUF5683 domain-containing protein [Rhodothermales bacterium]
MRKRIVVLRIAVVAVAATSFLVVRSSVAQQESIGDTADSSLPADHSPRGALWRAAAAPGWGQLYNHQYYKLPVVWGGLAGFAGSALFVNHRYLRYRHAYLWIVRESATIDVPTSYEDDYLDLISDLGLTPEDADGIQGRLSTLFRQNRDNLRRNRDLLYIGSGLFYGLSILDAYVSAHLLDFDVGEDLSLSVRPAVGGFAASLRLRP